ncbi:hypothetical protein Airi02_105300 [Actinoallomurus iriomotensis]|uniref:Uncharacterized protein n=1 Tax=Actinoallomurus iriomotensis TaxID=478107 RepID=A0A9W6W719_9ACTN|nr:hypothetical protein Airi02_105300 [Actinoallomurus iriomotensis]
MTDWMRCLVASDTDRLPLRAYDTVLRDTPDRRAISPMFIKLLRGVGGRRPAVDRRARSVPRVESIRETRKEYSHPAFSRATLRPLAWPSRCDRLPDLTGLAGVKTFTPAGPESRCRCLLRKASTREDRHRSVASDPRAKPGIDPHSTPP